MKLAWAALSALSLGACSFIYDGEGLVGPGPDAGGAGDANAEGAADAAADALDAKAPVVVDAQMAIGGIAIDATYLYWTTESGKVTRRKRDGALVDEEIASGEAKPAAIAVDATHVYWTATKAVRRRALSGGAPETYASTVEDPSGLAAHPLPGGTLVYWSERNGGFVKSKGPAGENVIGSNTNRPSALTIARERLFVVLGEGQVHSVVFSNTIGAVPDIEGRRVSAIAGTASLLFFASQSNASIGSFNGGSGADPYTTLLTDVTASSIASDGGFLFFVEAGDARIRRMTL